MIENTKISREEFVEQLLDKADYFTDENYHTEAAFLGNLAAIADKSSEETWKDNVIKQVLTFNPY